MTPIVDTATEVRADEGGAIDAIDTAAHGRLTADLYIDCTGFRAELIGKALGVPYRSCCDALFCGSALAMQVSHRSADEPAVSWTVAAAQETGWVWGRKRAAS